ncbi:DEAD-box ATP-dependent RNA helicase 36-like [Papaver somniferum]|uniref:DEAD-box ATP-dependent RNA helicase 36-like n=1 Tax=Papaver somniferum TaxID=3469 RepID=UPI000E6F9AAE|nr:DEAD-box ATP-dependent RNA helicase 36-like [Papaver somniferum]
MGEDTIVDQPPLFSKKKFAPKVLKKPPLVIENPQPNEPLEVEKSCDPESYNLSFSDLGLSDWATRTCKELGMKKPTQVQHHCIPRILAGQDVLGLAQTGSGKTAAFALPILNRLAENPYGVFALVITPTRELAYQLAEQFRALGASLHLRCAVVVGGMDMITQAQALMQRPHVVIATPGRIKVLLEQNPDIPSVFSKTKFLVLDEADRVLDVGFEEELSAIFQYLPKDRQTLLFSATMTENLQTLLEVSANKAYFYEQYEGFKTVESLKQQYVFIPKNVKDVYLLHILSKMEDMGVRSAIIFVSTCRSCHLLSLILEELEQPAVGLHSHKSQALRLSALHRFKSGQTPILLATDVASRGLDIPTVDLVINYDIPRYARDYVHRVGRTARAGRGGLAVSFVTQNDVDLIHEIESVVGKQLDKFECKENDVLAEMTKVYKAKRIATMKMMDDGYEQKAEERKAQKLKTLSEKGLLKEKTNKKRRRTKTTSAEESK